MGSISLGRLFLGRLLIHYKSVRSVALGLEDAAGPSFWLVPYIEILGCG